MMRSDFFYRSPSGRALFNIMQALGFFRIAAWFLKTRVSRMMIPSYIARNHIDMEPFGERSYASFAEFFARRKTLKDCDMDPDTLISPCDGMLSIYEVTADLVIPMKGSHYRMKDLIPDPLIADSFRGGLCLVFRLEASDYHHFCAFDDMMVKETFFIPGKLHSVQPIACEKVSVFRLNRRWWNVLETLHFGRAVQIEVGAMAVGGVTFSEGTGFLGRGEEMGNFELSGSTIIVILDAGTRSCLEMSEFCVPAFGGKREVKVFLGKGIGSIASKGDGNGNTGHSGC